ncbi:hypothetical protein [Oricola nitratireducens]|uniref:hypothetical protein n=1 Tax=Oricola nitratireducens TaxID=2775868 RepID=UPI0018675AA9|nr:hypothetical protein [Oricola nitratireducens]
MSFRGIRFLLSAFALVSLLLGGGVYAHAYEISPRDHVHAAASGDHHGHTSGCPMCKEDERPVHCGANILMTASVADLDHPALAPQSTDMRYSQLAGHLLIPESPPPRAFPVLEM